MSRIWDLEPALLCTKHLAAEHRELHGVYAVISQGKKGYSKHPETLRWIGKLGALKVRHDRLKDEMTARGWKHKTELNEVPSGERYEQNEMLITVDEQKELLRSKGCLCRV